MKEFRTLKAMKKGLTSVKSGVASDTLFSAKAIYFIAKRIDELVKLERKRLGLQKSDFMYFVSYHLQSGLTFDEALKKWRKKTDTQPILEKEEG